MKLYGTILYCIVLSSNRCFLAYVQSQSTYFTRDETGLVCLPHRVHIFTRDETGVSVSAHSAGAYTVTLMVMVNVIKGGGRATPTLTSPGKFYPHDWMYARQQTILLCVLCGLPSRNETGRPTLENKYNAQTYMNVEIKNESSQFHFWKYINHMNWFNYCIMLYNKCLGILLLRIENTVSSNWRWTMTFSTTTTTLLTLVLVG